MSRKKRVRHYRPAGTPVRWCERSREEWKSLRPKGQWVHYTTNIEKVTCPDCVLNISEYMKERVSNA